MTLSSPTDAFPSSRWWLLWAVSVFGFLLVTLPNLGLWPTLFQDEMQIIDFGRVFLDPQTDWSMGWLVNDSMPSRPLFFIGVVLQEWAYQALLPAYTGARISSVVGAVLACWAAFGWLLSRGTPRLPALMLSLAFLLEPIFNESYRQGRVDSWAFFTCLAACWLLRRAAATRPGGRAQYLPVLLAGMLSAGSVFVWPTSVILIPLILNELWATLRAHHRGEGEQRRRHWVRVVFYYGLGGAMLVAACLIPFFLHYEASLISLEHGTRVQKAAAVIQRSMTGMVAIYSPWLVPALILSVLLRREWALLAGMALAVTVMLQTMVYPARILYLLPYVVAIIAGAATAVDALPYAPRRKIWMTAALVFMLGGNLWVSAVKRPLMATQQAEVRAADHFDRALEAAIGAGPYRVVTTEWEIYYAARALGWKLYYPFGTTRKSGDDYRAFLRSMDYAITRDSFAFSKPIKQQELEQAGFVRQPDLTIGPGARPPGEIGQGLENQTVAKPLYEQLVLYRNSARLPQDSTTR